MTNPSELKFVRQDKPDAPDLVRCWAAQAGPARALANLRNTPVLVVQAEASYHAAFDHCTMAYLRQAGVSQLRFVRLADAGIKGNGHMLMLEKNNLDIAGVVEQWLRESVERGDTGSALALNEFPGHPALDAGVQQFHTPLAAPRIPPLDPPDWTPAIRAMLDPSASGRPVANVYRTYAQHPALYVPRQLLSEYIRTGSTLTPRVREMLILRIGFLCQSAYEWAAHARAGRAAGLTADDIARIAEGPAAGWSPEDAALLQAVDDLFNEDRVAPATWSALATRFDEKQLLDALITAGGYRMVSMSLSKWHPSRTAKRCPAGDSYQQKTKFEISGSTTTGSSTEAAAVARRRSDA